MDYVISLQPIGDKMAEVLAECVDAKELYTAILFTILPILYCGFRVDTVQDTEQI